MDGQKPQDGSATQAPLPGEPIFLHRSAPEELNTEETVNYPPLVKYALHENMNVAWQATNVILKDMEDNEE